MYLKMITAIAGVFSTVAITSAPAALADEAGYLAELHGAGVQAGDRELVGLGHEFCDALSQGAPSASLNLRAAAMRAPIAHMQALGIPRGSPQATALAHAYRTQLCP